MFAETLRKLRKSRNLTQAQLASAIYISKGAISQYERGKTMPSRATLDQLASYFSVSSEYLMGTSRIEQLEELMNEKYFNDTKVSDLLEKCMNLRGKDRDVLLTIVDALEAHSEGM